MIVASYLVPFVSALGDKTCSLAVCVTTGINEVRTGEPGSWCVVGAQ